MLRFTISTLFKITVITLIGIMTFSSLATSQNLKFSEDPTTFMGEFKKTIEASKNATYIQAAKDLETNWETNLNTAQRLQFINLVKALTSKGQKVGPIMHLTVKNVNYLAQQGGDINGFMVTMEQAIAQYDGKTYQKILEMSQLITEKKTLYQSNFNKLYLISGQYRFRFQEPIKDAVQKQDESSWDTPIDTTGAGVPTSNPLPILAGALLDLQNATFAIVSTGDSVAFGPSTGSISLAESIFVGKDGQFNWQSAGSPDTYVNLGDYAFNITKPFLKAENVSLTHPNLGQPLLGALEYKSVKKPAGKPSSGFPKFVSNGTNAALKNYPNIIYKGGFALHGHEILTYSRKNTPAEITVLFQNQPAFKATSKQFALRDSLISAQIASFTLPLGQDSLYHPGIVFKYNDSEGQLSLDRINKSEYKDLPYQDTYHKVYLWAESGRWNLSNGQFQLYMVSGKTEAPAQVESVDFFHKGRFNSLTQEFGFQPLLVAANSMTVKKKKTVHPNDIAPVVKKSSEIIRRVLERLTLDDFFNYHSDIDEFSLSRKGIFYIMANSNKTDFDNFRISSRFPSNNELANLSISLKDTILTIRGVERFIVSDSLKITGIPSDRIIKMGKNRDFVMNGKLQSSNFKFNGRNLKFNYGDFFINMTEVDSITYVPRDNYAKGVGGEIGGSVNYDKGGTFYLSDAKNKSGTQKGTSGSPRILIPDGITVYFNQPERGDWKYPQEVNFKVPKLDVGGLDKKDIEFNGDFYSNGILPPIKTILKSMPDNSLGFEYTTPVEGIKVYNNLATAKFPEKLKMDNTGLHGKGSLTYLAAQLTTENMILMADSMIAHGAQASIKEMTVNKAYFPKVDIKEFQMLWRPLADSMLLTTKGNAFGFYNGSTNLDGNLIVRSTGLFGDGTLKRSDSELHSNSIKFKKEGYEAKNATINITGGTGDLPILAGKGLNVDFNIINGSAQLSKISEGFGADSAGFSLPQANYYTNVDQAVWNTKTKTVTMKAPNSSALFRSLHPDQEGLEFNGNGAIYTIDRKTLNVTGVPFIKAAGMNIIPNKGDVFVDEKGDIQTFTKARIEIDTLNITHRMSDANIKIFSKNKLEGSATYQYITTHKDTFNIKLGNFELHELADPKKGKNAGPKASSYTTATALISDEDKLFLAPGISYKGDIKFTSFQPSLDLDGFIRPQLKSRAILNSSWIQYKEKPGANIRLKVDKALKNEDNIPLYAGFHFGITNPLYPTFLSFKEDERDPNLLLVEGLMEYNSDKKVFQIIQNTGADTLSQPKVLMSFDDKKGLLDFNGKVTLSGSLINASAIGQAQVDSMRLNMNTMMAINLPALTPITPELAEKIVATNLEEGNSEPAEDDLQRLFTKLELLIGVNETKVYADKLASEYKPLPTASSIFDVPLVLSNVNLNWSPIHNAFYSTGMIGVANLGKSDINAQMEGMLEIRKSDQGDNFSLYFEVSPDLWYYFELIGKELGVVSSDMNFNDVVSAKSRNAKIKDMSLIPLGPEDKTIFVDRYYTSYVPNLPRKPKTVKKTTTQKAKPKETKKKEETTEGF